VASLEEAIFNRFKALFDADTGEGTFTDRTLNDASDNDAYVPEFKEIDNEDSDDTQSIIKLDVPSTRRMNSFTAGVYSAEVNLHIHTASRRLYEKQRAISDRCITVFGGAAAATQNSHAISSIVHNGGHRLQKSLTRLHHVERFSVVVCRGADISPVNGSMGSITVGNVTQTFVMWAADMVGEAQKSRQHAHRGDRYIVGRLAGTIQALVLLDASADTPPLPSDTEVALVLTFTTGKTWSGNAKIVRASTKADPREGGSPLVAYQLVVSDEQIDGIWAAS